MRIAPREGMSPRGASIALASFSGAPDAVSERFQYLFRQAVERRDVDLVEGAKTHYFLRGYLSATPDEGNTLVAAVWDVFDSSKNRLQRLKNIRLLKGGAADPWMAVTDQTLQELSVSAAENLAAFLSNMPEAQPVIAQANATGRTQSLEGRAVGTMSASALNMDGMRR